MVTPKKDPRYYLKVGNPTKYDKRMPERVFQLSLLGLKNPEISKILCIDLATFYRWLKEYPELRQQLNDGRAPADGKVVASMYKKACGYTDEDGKIYPPDTSAGVFWLKNRQRNLWRDKHDIEVETTVKPSIIHRRDGSKEELGFTEVEEIEEAIEVKPREDNDDNA